MSKDDDDNVKRLNVRFKAPPEDGGEMLRIVRPYSRDECNHRWRMVGAKQIDAHYLIREGETEVECGLCGTRLDPMFVLMRLATEEQQWSRTRKAYQDEMSRLNKRRRTKCDHCGQMARISAS